MFKKMVFTAAIVGTFAAGMFMSINDSEARKLNNSLDPSAGGSGSGLDCYSASSGTVAGAYFYDCGTFCPKQENKMHSGAAGKCK